MDYTASIVRILAHDGNTRGTGFVVSRDGLIATCAHVLKETGDQGQGDAREVTVVFKVNETQRKTKIIENYWRAPEAEDLAILRLEGPVPEGVEVLPLGSSAGTTGHRLATFGFPNVGPIKGIYGSGVIAGLTKDQAGNSLLQVRDATDITLGHSGAPVWDELKHCVVGMVTAVSRPDQLLRLSDITFAIPSETIAAVCPELQILHGLDIFHGHTKLTLSTIADTIGGISLPRDNELTAVDTTVAEHRLTFVTGRSGCGKTVVLKKLAESKLTRSSVLWLDASALDADGVGECERRLGLPVSLSQALSEVSSGHTYFLIDGLDREFRDRVFGNLAVILGQLHLDDLASPWRILITTRDEELQRLQSALLSRGVIPRNVGAVSLNEPTIEELRPVWKAFPNLAQLAFRPHLRRLLLKPKILDLFACRLVTGGFVDTSQWAGESDLIEWFWSSEIDTGDEGPARDRFVKLLAEKQATELHSEIAADKFGVPDVNPVSGLCQSGICRKVEERYTFAHDLFGDWARQKILLGRRRELHTYLADKQDSPLWHRAIRLLALHLLEREPVENWIDLFNIFEPDVHGSRFMQNLVLEASVFAANAGMVLEKLWESLLSLDGSILHRLLGQFLQVATVENVVIMTVAEVLQPGSRSFAKTVERIPLSAYWPPMLKFLHKHKSEVIRLAPNRAAEIAEKWLRYSGTGWTARDEAAEIALDIAEDRLGLKMCHEIIAPYDEHDDIVFKAALGAAKEAPNRVADFALTASRRKLPGTGVLLSLQRYEEMARQTRAEHGRRIESEEDLFLRRRRAFVVHREYEIPPRWPYGPSERVEEAFRKVCLTSDALVPLIEVKPWTARSVVLALLIPHPVPRSIYGDDSFPHFDLELEADSHYWPAFHSRPPFSTFLRMNRAVAFDLILSLVDFVTERWADRFVSRGSQLPRVEVVTRDGPMDFVGDHNVFDWFRHGGHVPKAVSSALMAVEKWFYDRLEANESMGDAVETILQKGGSVAFLGLLCEIGKRYPALFASELLPLLRIPQLYFWDEWRFRQGENPGLIAWSFAYKEPVLLIRLAQEWFQLPHRKQSLMQIALQLFRTNNSVRQHFEDFRREWRKLLAEFDDDSRGKGFLENLIATFDPSNKLIEDTEGNVYVVRQASAQTDEQKQLSQDRADRQLLLNFPFRCRQILDGKQKIEAEGLEDFWEQLQHLASARLGHLEVWKVFGSESCLCGGAAVLLKLHRCWLKDHPERENWCMNQVQVTPVNPPDADAWDNSIVGVSVRWQGFCAEALPSLWAEEPDSPLLREPVARLAFDIHYETVKTLCQSASEHRNQLGDSFRQLQQLILTNCAVRYLLYADWVPDPPNLNIKAWVQRQIDDFVDGRTAVGIEEWNKIAEKVRSEIRPLISNKNYEFFSSRPEMDLHLIAAAYAWLPDLQFASSREERLEWIGFWKRALDYSAGLYQEHLERESDSNSENREWHQWLFDRLALVIPGMTPEEHPEDLWKPILELGVEGHNWVELFLSSWFTVNLQVIPPRPGFSREWKKMIEFASSWAAWSSPTGTHYDRQIIWCNLMGFGGIRLSLWTEAHRNTVTEMRDLYAAWAQQFLPSLRCAANFAAFLIEPAADDLLPYGIVWLATAIEAEGVRIYWDKTDESTLSSFVGHCWNLCRSSVRKDSQTFSAFRSILRVLADRQNPVAMQILSEVASAP
jgi:hypothetical protein